MSYVIAVIGILILVLFVYEVASRSRRAKSSGSLQEIDLAALSNLLDASQDAFIRSHLDAEQVRWYKRERNRVLLAYIEAIGENCRRLLPFAQAFRRREQLR